MNWLDATLNDFGRQLGLADLRFDQQGVVQLGFSDQGSLGIERRDDEVLIYLVRPLDYHDATLAERALKLVERRQGWRFPVQTGSLPEQRLLFLTRLPHAAFTLPALEEALQLLDRLHRQLAAR
ncbi:type III secretion chaperone SycN [Chitinimonas lacunae]|uniref:Type III secretion chaperone SycN n=1 Tax=Chitinimonas lacunae TaxID=1963018 RepID=A0ABV8MSJ9_9NEIS